MKIRLEGPAGDAGELFGQLRQIKGWSIAQAEFKPEESRNEGDVVVYVEMESNKSACTRPPEGFPLN
ncbi:hypothetical protein [Curtanaerobium respiraculi]|uniref:hypothetical protein n=1 Tax=Curtanaerobium respiraculi TaxID=2949669 RepID=UPI0024B37B90|nr:hypothetical protein [Curtanaerobium respiraculi]